MTLNKIVVYTALFGNYDNLKKPLFVSSKIDYICFTNRKNLKSKIWKIKYIEPIFDNKKMNRYIKMHPHIFLSEYEISVYIDSNLEIIFDIIKKINLYLKNKFIALPIHPFRKSIIDEINFCYKNNLINEQVFKMILSTNKEIIYFIDTKYHLTANRLIIRKHNNKDCIKLMESWWQEYFVGITRDQISLPIVLYKNNYNPELIYSNFKFIEYYIVWPHINDSMLNKIKFYIKMFFYFISLRFFDYIYDIKRKRFNN